MQQSPRKFWEVWGRSDALYNRWAAAHGVNNYRLFVLYVLDNHPGATQKAIADHAGLPKQTVNTVVRALRDEGYVTLVNAEKKNGVLTETDKHTGLWAWKHPHTAEGTVTYTKLTGDVRLFDVDFAYTEGKTVLKNVSIYAKPGQKVAFVGATGAGKTTITNLLNRFYDIADGKIRYLSLIHI